MGVSSRGGLLTRHFSKHFKEQHLQLHKVGWHYLSNATCQIRPHLFYVFFGRVKDHHNLLHYSPLLKKACVRQVVLDKWFPLIRTTHTI